MEEEERNECGVEAPGFQDGSDEWAKYVRLLPYKEGALIAPAFLLIVINNTVSYFPTFTLACLPPDYLL
jgi:hypothetical protein